nr:MAG TPA: hypothetical protein [Caudoviricetes sp.]
MDASNIVIDFLCHDNPCNLQQSVLESIVKHILVECRV